MPDAAVAEPAQTPPSETPAEATSQQASEPAVRETARGLMDRVFAHLPENEYTEHASNEAREPKLGAQSGKDEESSSPDQPKDGPEATSETESKPSEAPTDGKAEPAKPSRRQTAEEANKARIAELEAAVAARDAAVEAARTEERERIQRESQEADTRRAQESLSAQQQAEAALFEQACRMSDADPRLNEAAPDGSNRTLYQWREDRKELISQYPQAEAAIRAEVERSVADKLVEADRLQAKFWSDVEKRLKEAENLPHVNPADLKTNAENPLSTWDKVFGYYHAAGAAWKEAELSPQIAERDEKIAQLEDEVRDLKAVGPRGLVASRAPVSGGRSVTAGDQTTFDPSRPARENLAAALGF